MRMQALCSSTGQWLIQIFWSQRSLNLKWLKWLRVKSKAEWQGYKIALLTVELTESEVKRRLIDSEEVDDHMNGEMSG